LVLRNLRCLEFVCVLGQQRQPVHRVIKIHLITIYHRNSWKSVSNCPVKANQR
jgi:hypothetical protein